MPQRISRRVADVIDGDIENFANKSYRSEVWKRKMISSKYKPWKMTQKMDEWEWRYDELNYSGSWEIIFLEKILLQIVNYMWIQ